MRTRAKWVFALALIVTLACGDSIGPRASSLTGGPQSTTPGYGWVVVTTSTQGGSPDPDGYVLAYAGAQSGVFAVPHTGASGIRLRPGSYSITVSDVSPNCILSNPGPYTLSLAPGESDTLPLVASCAPANGAILVVPVTLASQAHLRYSDASHRRYRHGHKTLASGVLFTGLADGRYAVGIPNPCENPFANFPGTVVGGDTTIVIVYRYPLPPGICP